MSMEKRLGTFQHVPLARSSSFASRAPLGASRPEVMNETDNSRPRIMETFSAAQIRDAT